MSDHEQPCFAGEFISGQRFKLLLHQLLRLPTALVDSPALGQPDFSYKNLKLMLATLALAMLAIAISSMLIYIPLNLKLMTDTIW
jgi:hypothetical protein